MTFGIKQVCVLLKKYPKDTLCLYSIQLFDGQKFDVKLENSMWGDLRSTSAGPVSKLVDKEQMNIKFAILVELLNKKENFDMNYLLPLYFLYL